MKNEQLITFIDLRLDYAFKLIFGTHGNEDLLLKLINAILPEKHFTSVTLSTNEQVGLRPDSRKAVFDIFATTSDGSDITIEMQWLGQGDFNQRMIFYSTFPVQNHVKKGKGDGDNARLFYTFPPLYVVGITDFILQGVPETPDVINVYSIRNEKYLDYSLSSNVTYVTVELPKLKKTLEELVTPADYLLYAIRNIGQMNEMPNQFKGQGLDKLFELCRFAHMTEEQQRQYLAELMAELDEGSRMATAINEGLRRGRTEGHSQGLAEGRAESRSETARAMLADNMDPQLIAKYTGLTAEEIAAL